jgi:hypothetical protein
MLSSHVLAQCWFEIWVARWFVFKPKITIWVNFGILAMEDVGIFYGRLVYFMAIWHILLQLGKFERMRYISPVW